MAFLPLHRERGKQMDGAGMALQEHFRYPCNSPEVTIDLERRMGIEKIGQG